MNPNYNSLNSGHGNSFEVGNKFITYLRINEMKIIMELSQIKELF